MDAPALPSCVDVFPWQLWEGLMWEKGELSSPDLTPEEQLDFLWRRPLLASRQKGGTLLWIANSGTDGEGTHKSVKSTLWNYIQAENEVAGQLSQEQKAQWLPFGGGKGRNITETITLSHVVSSSQVSDSCCLWDLIWPSHLGRALIWQSAQVALPKSGHGAWTGYTRFQRGHMKKTNTGFLPSSNARLWVKPPPHPQPPAPFFSPPFPLGISFIISDTASRKPSWTPTLPP